MTENVTASRPLEPMRSGPGDHLTHEINVGRHTIDVLNPNPPTEGRYKHLFDLRGAGRSIEELVARHCIPAAMIRGGLRKVKSSELAYMIKALSNSDSGEAPVVVVSGEDVHTLVAAIAGAKEPMISGLILIEPDLSVKPENPELDVEDAEGISLLQQAAGFARNGLERVGNKISRRRQVVRYPGIIKELKAISVDRQIPVSVILSDAEDPDKNTNIIQQLDGVKFTATYTPEDNLYPEKTAEYLTTDAVAAQFAAMVDPSDTRPSQVAKQN